MFRSLVLSLIVALGFAGNAYADALPTFVSCGIASLSGASQTLTAANFQRKYLLVCNTGNQNLGVSFVGGTAAIGGAGTLTLTAGSCKEYALNSALASPPSNAVTAIGTAAQSVACLEGR